MSDGRITVYSLESGTANCKLGETIVITGSNIKTGLFDSWRYSIFIGSGIGETLLISDQKGSKLKEGIEHRLDASLVEHAYPYGSGRSCYIRAVGTKGDETTEYRAFIFLYGDLLPKFDLSVTVDNGELADFGNNAVKGFSKVTAKITPGTVDVRGDIVSETAAAQFTGGIFSKTFSGNKEEYSVTLDPIETSGEVYVFANVASTLGYQKSESCKFNVLNYQKPRMSFDISPIRFDETTGEDILKVTKDNKNGRFSVRFAGKISPCSMKDENGIQICRIKEIESKAKLKRLDDGEAEIELDISDINENGERIFEYSGKPYFEGPDIEGLEVYKAYNLILTCRDSTGIEYTMVKRINTLGTAFHLGRGGNKASFGKYAEEDELVDSAWSIHSDEGITAEEEIRGKTISTKEGIKFCGEDDAVPDETLYYGVGTGEKNFAKGSHTHGYITADGRFFVDADNALKNMILITDKEGRIIGTEKLSTEQLAMAKEENITDADLGMKPSALVPTIGTPEAGMCYANHTHPYSTAWKDDKRFTELVNSVDALLDAVNKL